MDGAGSTPRIAAPGRVVAMPTRRTAASFRQIAARLHPRRCATHRRRRPMEICERADRVADPEVRALATFAKCVDRCGRGPGPFRDLPDRQQPRRLGWGDPEPPATPGSPGGHSAERPDCMNASGRPAEASTKATACARRLPRRGPSRLRDQGVAGSKSSHRLTEGVGVAWVSPAPLRRPRPFRSPCRSPGLDRCEVNGAVAAPQRAPTSVSTEQ